MKGFKFHTVCNADFFSVGDRNYMKVVLPNGRDAAVDMDSGIVREFNQSDTVYASMLQR